MNSETHDMDDTFQSQLIEAYQAPRAKKKKKSAHAVMDPTHAVMDSTHAVMDSTHAVMDSTHAMMNSTDAMMDPAQALVDPVDSTIEHINPNRRTDAIQPKSEEDYRSMADQAIALIKSGKFPKEQEEYYQGLVNFYTSLQGKEINLTDPAVLRSFLAYKKLVKYNGNVPTRTGKGRYSETSAIVGYNSKTFNHLMQSAPTEALEFSNWIYNSDSRFQMLDPKDAEKAEEIGRRLLDEKLEATGLIDEEITFDQSDFVKGTTFLHDVDNKCNDWEIQIVMDPNSFNEEEHYCPKSVIFSHELSHVMQITPGMTANEFYSDRSKTLAELAPTIELICNQDQIYKEIHGIPLEQEVEYPTSDPSHINLGRVANKFRAIKEKYHATTYDEILMTPEALEVMREFNMEVAANRNNDHSEEMPDQEAGPADQPSEFTTYQEQRATHESDTPQGLKTLRTHAGVLPQGDETSTEKEKSSAQGGQPAGLFQYTTQPTH